MPCLSSILSPNEQKIEKIDWNQLFDIFKHVNSSKQMIIVNIICFDLLYIVDCMDSNIEPELNGFKISREGKEWIKLLTFKEWMKKISIQGKIKIYPLPKI